MHHCVNYSDANKRLSRFQLLLRSISTGAISEPHVWKLEQNKYVCVDMGAIHLCAYIFYLIDILIKGVMAMKQETVLSEI